MINKRTNYEQKIEEHKRIKDLFKSNYPEGTIKWSHESLEHFLVKCQVVYFLKDAGYEVWTEVSFKSGQRCDILALKGHISYCFEIIHSESNKSVYNKQETYPIDVIRVNCKDFKYNNFCI